MAPPRLYPWRRGHHRARSRHRGLRPDRPRGAHPPPRAAARADRCPGQQRGRQHGPGHRRRAGPGRLRPGPPHQPRRQPGRAALTTKALEDRLAPGGAVVHIGSIAAEQAAGSYGAAKAGLANWNIDLAGRLGSRDITANVVAPGCIADAEFFRDKLSGERREQLVAATATGRAGAPSDIAGAVAFLASPAARHVTGQVLHVNGGAHATR